MFSRMPCGVFALTRSMRWTLALWPGSRLGVKRQRRLLSRSSLRLALTNVVWFGM